VLLWFWRSYSVRPIHLLGGIGVLFFLAATVFGGRTVYLFVTDRKLSSTLEPLLTVFSFIAGLLFVSLGILTDILIKDLLRHLGRALLFGSRNHQERRRHEGGRPPKGCQRKAFWMHVDRHPMTSANVLGIDDASAVPAALKQVGISAFPLSMGRDTGRGLERVIAELVLRPRGDRAALCLP